MDLQKSSVAPDTPHGVSCFHAAKAGIFQSGPLHRLLWASPNHMSGTCGPQWSLAKASGGDFVKDKWPGPASGTELEGNPGCGAMNQ